MGDRGAFIGAEIIEALERQDVRYVVIGGAAAIAHGVQTTTRDIDITPDASTDNLERLASALRELGARLRTSEPEGVPFVIDAESLKRSAIWTLVTDRGQLDVSFVPTGTQGYDDLRRSAVAIRLRSGTEFQVASLLDVIRSKEAAGRPKDIAVLPLLRQTLEEIRKLEGRGHNG